MMLIDRKSKHHFFMLTPFSAAHTNEMSNLYGYSDYIGPIQLRSGSKQQGDYVGSKVTESGEGSPHGTPFPAGDNGVLFGEHDSDDSSLSETNPLQVGFWMEGDSLAPPCGTSRSTIHALLEFAQVSSSDVVYDLGCGDGRICLEAFHKYKCRTVGVEVEEDLVQRAHMLLKDYSDVATLSDCDTLGCSSPLILHRDLRVVVELLVDRAQPHPSEHHQSKESVRELCDLTLPLPLPTVLVMYLLPEAISILEEPILRLLLLLPNLRVICNTWGMLNLQETDKSDIKESSGAITTLFLYSSQSLANAGDRSS